MTQTNSRGATWLAKLAPDAQRLSGLCPLCSGR